MFEKMRQKICEKNGNVYWDNDNDTSANHQKKILIKIHDIRAHDDSHKKYYSQKFHTHLWPLMITSKYIKSFHRPFILSIIDNVDKLTDMHEETIILKSN